MSRLKLIPFAALLCLCFGCGGLTTKQIQAFEESVVDPLSLRTSEMNLDGRAEEAAELWRKAIRESGITIARQNGLCSSIRSAVDFNNLRECLNKLESMLEAKKPNSQEELQSFYRDHLNNDGAYTTLIDGYIYLGEFSQALPITKAYFINQKAGDVYWYSAASFLAEIYAGLNNYSELRNLESTVSQVLAQKQSPPDFMWFYELTSIYSAVDDKEALERIKVEIDSLNPSDREDGLGILFETSTKLQVQHLISLKLKDYTNALQLNNQKRKIEELKYFDDIEKNKTINNEKGNTFLTEMYDAEKVNLALNEAEILIKLKRYSEARVQLEYANQNKKKALAADYFEEQFNLHSAQLADGEGNNEEAIKYYKTLIKNIENKRSSIQRENDKLKFLATKVSSNLAYEGLIRILIKKRMFDEAFEYAERAKSRAMVDMLASKQNFNMRQLTGDKTINSSTLLRDIRIADSAGASLDQVEPDKLSKLRSIADTARAKIKSEYPELAALVSVTFTPAAELREMLRKNETLIEYFGGNEKLYAFVVTRDNIRAVTLDYSVLNKVEAFRKAIQNPKSKDTGSLSKSIYSSLISPLQLPKNGLLTVVPHGSLHYLPFAALNNGKSALLERYTLRLLPSASLLPLLSKHNIPETSKLLIFGNPDLGEASYDLPGAQKEAEQIAKLLPDAKLLLRSEANKDAVIQMGAKYSYLHFASHGTFDSRKPRQSGLLLAVNKGSNDPTDGMLTVDDLYMLNLNADLVTLSACETALGSVQTGDDVIGLTRGFFFAGANSIISSLWQVDDAATGELMVKFYQLLPKLGKAEALRQAQLNVMSKYPHPFYWAAFQFAGSDVSNYLSKATFVDVQTKSKKTEKSRKRVK